MEWIVKEQGGGERERCVLEASGTGKGQVADSCEHGNENSGPIKAGNLSNWVNISFSRRILLYGIS
jgi:hypothetical protein